MLDKTYKDTWNTREQYITTSQYKEYLKSDLWKEIKNKVKNRPNYKHCYVCGTAQDLELHHLSYNTLDTSDLRNIRSVCGTCHETIHQYAKEKNLSVRLASRHIKKRYKPA